MKCLRCGAEIPDNSIRCTHCGIKVNMVCPDCNNLVPFGTKTCSHCGFILIKNCPECNASNIYSAQNCRKCGYSLINEEKNEEGAEVSAGLLDENIVSQENEAPVQMENSVDVFNQGSQEIDNHISLPKQDETVDVIDEPELLQETEEVTSYQEGITQEEEIEVAEKIEIAKEEETLNINDTKEEPVIPLINSIEQEQISTLNSFSAGHLADYSTKEKFVLPQKHYEQTNDSIPIIGENENIRFFNIDEFQDQNIDKFENEALKVNKEPEVDVEEIINSVDIEKIEEIPEEEVFESINSEQYESYEEASNIKIQKDAIRKVTQIIKTSIKKHIIAITGEEGCGKTALIRQVEDNLRGNGFIFLYGSCTPLVQITSFGFFQDAFLRIMGFPPYTRSFENFVRDFKKSQLSNLFNFLNERELYSFLNIFYPCKKDKFENIQINKMEMFHILEKVIKSFSINNNLVITIDNFDLLDGASYDFIVYMLEKGYFTNRVKLLVSYQENKHIESFFDLTKINDNIFETVELEKLSDEEMVEALKYSIDLDINKILPANYLDELIQKSNGNSLRFEQEVALLFDSDYITLMNDEIVLNDDNKPEVPPSSLEELIKLRLNFLSPASRNMLFLAAIMGFRFASGILEIVAPLSSDKASNLIEYLKQELFFVPVDNYTYEFKSLSLWKLIYQEAKKDLLYKENSTKLYEILKPLNLSSNLQKLISCTEALSKTEAFYIWQNTAGLSAKLGDTNLFIIAQKQCLKLLEEHDFPNSEDTKAKIYEQIGKILYKKSPAEAITYLSNVLDAEIKVSNIIKIVDLSGYFVRSCYLVGNFFGAVEAIDAIISNIELTESEVSDVNLALIKTRKLKALLNIGNSEQIINLVNEEIILHLEKVIEIDPNDAILIDAWLLSKTVLAKAYAMQGNNEVFSVIDSIREFLENHDYNKEYYLVQVNLIEAFGQTIIGNINKSNEILNKISSDYKDKTMETDLLADWNLISIINRVFMNQISDLKADLFELATFTNNINEHFTKNIIKLILGFVLKEEGNLEKAKEIIDEQTTYFAKEKVSIGFLLSWLMLVQLTIEAGDDDKALNTATKSLEIATSPKINNYIFTIYFQKFLSEIYLRKGDLTAAKMYIEKSVMIAKQFNLKYQLIELYLSYGDYMKEFMRLSKNYAPSNVSLTQELYNKAVLSAKELNIESLTEKAVRERTEFKTFCQLNSIDV